MGDYPLLPRERCGNLPIPSSSKTLIHKLCSKTYVDSLCRELGRASLKFAARLPHGASEAWSPGFSRRDSRPQDNLKNLPYASTGGSIHRLKPGLHAVLATK